jgi:glucose-6-phosphate 1-epimerase
MYRKQPLTFRLQIRGGIPIAFPQFARQGSLPLHGFAREKKWRVDKVCSVSRWGQPASAILTLDSDSTTRAVWDFAFKLELTVMLWVVTELCAT